MERINVLERKRTLVSELYDPIKTPWKEIKARVAEIEKASFGDDGFPPEVVEEIFTDPRAMAVFLKSRAEDIVGYSVATPHPENEAGMHIALTAIDPAYRKQGGVEKIMKLMEEKMRARGITFMTRDALVKDGYADAIEKNYADRIIEKRDHDSPHGEERYFKIAL